MALDVMESIRCFLRHVLPAGFMKVRYYGLVNPNTAIPHERLSALIEMAYGFELERVPQPEREPTPPMLCPHCGGLLIYCWSLRPCQRSP